jgi:Na+-transporting methylmalonyl-CoA/oxaloacetate decarboxylase gamma subunit
MTTDTNAFVETVKPDAQGYWSYTLPTNLPPGYHRVEVDDGQGGHAEAGMYLEAPGKTEQVFVVKEQVSLVDRVERVMPGGIGWLLLVLLLVVAVLAGMNIVLARRAEKAKEEAKRQRLLQVVMAVSALSVVVAFAVGALVHRKAPVFEEIVQQIHPAAAVVPIDVTGSVVAVRGGQGVAGVDLAVGNMSIRTQVGGRYVFQKMDPSVGIRLTHPDLKRAFVWSLKKGGEVALPYDVALYNALVDVMDAESRGRADQVYDLLPATEKASISKEQFVEERRDRISSRRLLQQEVVLEAIESHTSWVSPQTAHAWDEVAFITTEFGTQRFTYVFAYDQGGWHLVR